MICTFVRGGCWNSAVTLIYCPAIECRPWEPTTDECRPLSTPSTLPCYSATAPLCSRTRGYALPVPRLSCSWVRFLETTWRWLCHSGVCSLPRLSWVAVPFLRGQLFPDATPLSSSPNSWCFHSDVQLQLVVPARGFAGWFFLWLTVPSHRNSFIEVRLSAVSGVLGWLWLRSFPAQDRLTSHSSQFPSYCCWLYFFPDFIFWAAGRCWRVWGRNFPFGEWRFVLWIPVLLRLWYRWLRVLWFRI